MVDPHGRVTLQQVAERAQVSLATASRALNGSARTVNPALADRVLTAARDLNYTVNRQAQAMVRGRTTIVGVVLADIVDPYFSSIAAGVMARADQLGLLVTLAATERRPERECDHVTMFSSLRAQAVLLIGSRSTDQVHEAELASRMAAFERGGGRVVVVGQPLADFDAVVVENRAGATDLAQVLIGLGHTRFAILAGPADLVTSVDRCEGFREAVLAAGLPEPVVVHDAFSREGGHAGMHRLLDSAADVTCVFGVSDAVAVGAMTAARERGVDVPGQMSVAGFDDVPWLRDIHPALTTYRLPLETIGDQALGMAVELGGEVPRRMRVAGEVVLRDSTRAAL